MVTPKIVSTYISIRPTAASIQIRPTAASIQLLARSMNQISQQKKTPTSWLISGLYLGPGSNRHWHCNANRILSPTRLPIPPPRPAYWQICFFKQILNIRVYRQPAQAFFKLSIRLHNLSSITYEISVCSISFHTDTFFNVSRNHYNQLLLKDVFEL